MLTEEKLETRGESLLHVVVIVLLNNKHRVSSGAQNRKHCIRVCRAGPKIYGAPYKI